MQCGKLADDENEDLIAELDAVLAHYKAWAGKA